MKSDTQKTYNRLRELLAAAGHIAFECSNSDREAYEMARLALIEILRKTANPLDPKDLEDLSSPSSSIH